MAKRPRIALVLGAGSARGLAHIGVLQVFEENQIPFDFIVGSSMGAIVEALCLRCGYENAGANVGTPGFAPIFDVQLPRLGFISGKRIKELLDLMTKKKILMKLRYLC